MEILADIHPKIVHFPIAFLMLYPLMELLFLLTQKEFYTKAAFLFLIVGVLGAFFAVLSGNQAYEVIKDWSKKDLMIFSSHQTFANITVWYFTAMLALRFLLHTKKKLTRLVVVTLLLLALLGSYFVFLAGHYGGKLADANVMKSTLTIESIE